ncbi:DUF4426 domain-containing protein [Rheinheimera sp.]|uniref:DUF4426 domain-containing protein n=1 Tax=Rheinheimera sp. TaxID=1869214 RepID=UPI003AF536C0
MKTYLLALLFAVSLFSGTSQAEQKQALGPWDVHYIAFDSTLLDPAIAKNYGIERSSFNALLNISVLRSNDQQAQQVELSGKVRDLMGKTTELSFKQVAEGDAIYYLAQLPVRNEQHLTFLIDIRQGTTLQQLQFSQTFYTE